MFGKKKCNGCGEKIGNNHKFCPQCGNLVSKKSNKNDGMLGENDFTNELENLPNSIFGGMGAKVINKVFENTMKMIEREMQKEMRRTPHNEKQPRTNYRLFINGKRINTEEPNKNINQKEEKVEMKLPMNVLDSFRHLPKKEPKTNVRRFSDKVIYELNIPGVKSLNDISIMRLENSVEIKAVTKSKSYHKIIPINFPVVGYEFSNGKLVLELDSKE